MAERLAVVTSHPIQYQAPWFRGLAKVMDVQVFFCHRQDAAGQAAAGFGQAFDWDVPLLDGYAHEWLTNIARDPSVDAFGGCDTPGIVDRLRVGRFDACLVNGWYLKSYVQTVRACRRLGIPIVMRGDSQLATPRSRVWAAAKYWPYRWFLRRMDAHLYVGQANRRYLEHYGVRPSRLFPVRHFVDNEWFAGRAEAARQDGSRETLRQQWQASSSATVCLFAGKFIEKKRPLDFVRAVQQAAGDARRVLGVMVGSGPLQQEIERYVTCASAPIHFAGFRNQSEMPRYYAAADCLVLPSDGGETWGLVVNEAMACGLPAIVSAAVGCREDLVEPAVTGEVFPLGDIDSLRRTLTAMAARSPRAVATMRSAVRDRIRVYSCDAAVQGTVSAVRAVTARRQKVAS